MQIEIDPRIEKVVDKAYAEAAALYKMHGITAEDWPIIRQESPRILARIAEIEDAVTGTTPVEEVYNLLTAWVKNHESMFVRRAGAKSKVMGNGNDQTEKK